MTTADTKLRPLGDTDYAVPPGEALRELLEEQGLSQRDLARRAELSPKHVNKLLQGLVPLSADVAVRLERVTGTPARIWNRLEADYRSDLERIRSQRELSADVMWLGDFPVAELVKRDILPAEPADKLSRVEQMLAFFGVANVGAWQDVYAELACAFRTSRTYEAAPGALAAWLRLGEIAARDTYCEPFDHKRLQEALPSLRALTRESDLQSCTERLRGICASCGVAVAFIPELRGSRASGVARWLTPAKALIQLSFRYKTDDHLWFSFFHEIGHILRHGKTDVWIEATSSPDNPREAEADNFARDTLIPRAEATKLAGLKTVDDVRRFAARIGIAPGIVVGRLQHDSLWPYSRGNQLRRRLSFPPPSNE